MTSPLASLASLEADLAARLADAAPSLRPHLGGTRALLTEARALHRREVQYETCQTTRRRILAAALAEHDRRRRALASCVVGLFMAAGLGCVGAAALGHPALAVLAAGTMAGLVAWARALRV